MRRRGPNRYRRRLGAVIAMCLCSLAAIGALGSSGAAGSSTGGLLGRLATLDDKLGEFLKAGGKGLDARSVGFQIYELHAELAHIIDRYFPQQLYGAAAVYSFVKIDRQLSLADGAAFEAHHEHAAILGANVLRMDLESAVASAAALQERVRSAGAQPPPGLLNDLGRLHQQLQALVDRAPGLSYRDLAQAIGALEREKDGIITRYFNQQRIFSLPASFVILQLAAIESNLGLGEGIAYEASSHHAQGDRDVIYQSVTVAKDAKRKLEDALALHMPLEPRLNPIHAVFTPAPAGESCSQPYCTTVYTEDATGEDLTYTWTVSIPDDPGCAAGFHPSTPRPNQATWYHADASEGGPCNHTGNDYNASGYGHPGFVEVMVEDPWWVCYAIYHGTQGATGAPTGYGPEPQDCRARP